jgi:hypothetical protein
MVAENSPSEQELDALEATLLNKSGNVLLHNRFRALFTLKALKNERAIEIISKGFRCFIYLPQSSYLTIVQDLLIHLPCSSMNSHIVLVK